MTFAISSGTNTFILNLNEKLKENCPDLQLSIFSFGKDTFKLCLLNNNVCASYLIINNKNDNFNILSKTNIEYEGRGYNKFLTAVSICLADTMTTSEYLFSSTSVRARIHILSEYEHRLEENENFLRRPHHPHHPPPPPPLNFFVPIYKNKNKAQDIITKWINNKCAKSKSNVNGGGKKTRRNKQRQKNKKQRQKSKKNKTKRLYK